MTWTWQIFHFACFLWQWNEKELQIVFEKWSNLYFKLDIRPEIQNFNELYLPCDHTGWLDRDSHRLLLMNPDWRKIVWKPNTVANGILLPKLFWPTVRKKCSTDQEKLFKFEAEVQEFAKFSRSLEQFIQTVKGQNNFW